MKSIKNLTRLALATTLFSLVAGSAAFATPVSLAPGGTVTTFTPTTSSFTGTLVGDYTMAFSNAYENGTVLEDVYNNGGTLDFYYQVQNSATSTDTLTRLTVANFTGFTTAVDYLTGTGDTPTSANRQPSGDSVGFYLSIAPGTTTDWLEVATNATSFNSNGTISLLDTLPTTSTNALEPTAAPEPSTYALLGLGLIALAAAGRKTLFAI
jgi:hypothetical protein